MLKGFSLWGWGALGKQPMGSLTLQLIISCELFESSPETTRRGVSPSPTQPCPRNRACSTRGNDSHVAEAEGAEFFGLELEFSTTDQKAY